MYTSKFGYFMDYREDNRLISRCCQEADFDDPLMIQAMINVGGGETIKHTKHRKIWEFAFICRVLEEQGMLAKGRRGIGFAVGEEPLPSYFASRQVDVLASDLSMENPKANVWIDSGQNAGGDIEKLYKETICSRGLFDRHVRYRDIDMNDLPEDEHDYDFCWSSCAIEHVGSLDASKAFLRNAMKVLKNGGGSPYHGVQPDFQ